MVIIAAQTSSCSFKTCATSMWQCSTFLLQKLQKLILGGQQNDIAEDSQEERETEAKQAAVAQPTLAKMMSPCCCIDDYCEIV